MLAIINDKENNEIEITRSDGSVVRCQNGAVIGIVQNSGFFIREAGSQASIASGSFVSGITLDGEKLTPENINEKIKGLFGSVGVAPSPCPPVDEKRLLPDPIPQSEYDAMKFAGTLEEKYYFTYEDEDNG